MPTAMRISRDLTVVLSPGSVFAMFTKPRAYAASKITFVPEFELHRNARPEDYGKYRVNLLVESATGWDAAVEDIPIPGPEDEVFVFSVPDKKNPKLGPANT